MIWRFFYWFARLFMGGIFLYAGYAKIQQPFLFEMAVDSYQMLPPWAVIAVARTLPWLEAVLGLVLISGWKLPYFSASATLLLGFFLALMGISYARGVEATCGCFGGGEPVSPWTLTRDSMMLLVAVYLAVYSWKSRRSRSGAALPVAPPAGITG
ncbi:MAG: DoxX family membrane protein [Acidobacteria bacterium]|nr:DoxX family membrane protein [Acidobacteriota bacterium]